MATTPTDAINRINAANGNAYDVTNNPGGLAQGGHRQNFVPDLQAAVSVAQWSAASAGEAATSATATAADRVKTGQDVTTTGQYRDRAQEWANKPEDQVVTSGLYSAFHYAQKSALQVTLAANEVTLAANQVTLATNQANRSKTEADRSQGYANGLNIPALNSSVAGQFLKANSAGTAYEFGSVLRATASDITNSTGTGYVDSKTLGPILNEMRGSVGDFMESFKLTGAGTASWLLTNGAIIPRSTYPDLYSLIGNRYNDWATIAAGTITKNDTSTAHNLGIPIYVNGFVFIPETTYTGIARERLYKSTNDGLTFVDLPNSKTLRGQIRDIIYAGGFYHGIPFRGYEGGGASESLYSSNGDTWTAISEGGIGGSSSYGEFFCVATSERLVGVLNGTSNVFTKPLNSPQTPFAYSFNCGTSVFRKNCICVAANNRIFLISPTQNASAFRFKDDGGNNNNDFSTVNTSAEISNYLQNNTINDACVWFVNNNLYVYVRLANGAWNLWQSTSNGANFTLFMSVPANSSADTDILPNNIDTLFYDGDRLIIRTNQGNLYAIVNGIFIRLYFSTAISGFNPPSFKPNNDLIIFVPVSSFSGSGNVGPVTRARIAANKTTEFTLPKMNATIPNANRYIRGKTA